MVEYIEREALKRKLLCRKFAGKNLDGHELSFNDGVIEAIVAIDKMKAADVRPERHAKWLYVEDGIWECSDCGANIETATTPYCWLCGDKMDGKDGENND